MSVNYSEIQNKRICLQTDSREAAEVWLSKKGFDSVMFYEFTVDGNMCELDAVEDV